MDKIPTVSFNPESNDRSEVEPQVTYLGSRPRSFQARRTLRMRLIEKANVFSRSPDYRQYVFSRCGSDRMYRNVERDEIHREANMALMRKDCFQANYNDYIPSTLEKACNLDRLSDISFDDWEAIGKLQLNQEKMFTMANFRTPFENLHSSMSFGKYSLNRSFIKSNITLTVSNHPSIGSVVNQTSIGSAGINQASIGSNVTSPLPINQSSIGSGVTNQVPVNQLTHAATNQTIIGPKAENVIVDLIKNGMSPGDVAKLSDVFQYPSCFKNVTSSVIPWLKKQLEVGYWNNNSSLFILCLTMALSVGSVETIFKLNSTWGGLIFIFTYMVAFLFIVQPMFCFELGLGQLFRSSPFEIFEKLVPGMGGVGVAMVILCLLSACIASSRTCSEYIIYFINVLKEDMPWKLTPMEIGQCEGLGTNVIECTKLNPLCYIVDGHCKANNLGKAYLAYQNLFDNPDVDISKIDYRLVCGTLVTYFFVFILQMMGLTNFTFFAFILVVVIFFLAHSQVYFSTLLEGSTTYLFDSITKIDLTLLYKNSRIWSHSVRCCIYEYVIGNGIYSTLSSKSRIGYDLSSEALGVGILSGYITSLQFFSALAIVGYFCLRLSKMPGDILWMLEQDSSFVLLPMGFIASNNMERTLLVLQFCSCFILITFTLSIQIEVIMTTVSRFIKLKKIYIASAISLVMAAGCIPLCSRGGKRTIWFLEIAVGDLGRVFMVLMTCIVIGWFYGYQEQVKRVGRLPLYVFNATFWIGNIAASLGELLDETLPLYVMWLFRILGILLATVLSLLIYSLRSRKSKAYNPQYRSGFPIHNCYNIPRPFGSIKENYGIPSINTDYGKTKAAETDEIGDKIETINYSDPSVKSEPPSKHVSSRNMVIGDNTTILNSDILYNKEVYVPVGKDYEKVDSKTLEKLKQLKRKRTSEKLRDFRNVLYVLFLGNIEVFRNEFGRISPMNKTHNICWSIVWSVSIKWVSCCLLSNALADILEEIFSAERVERNIHTIPGKFKVLTIVIWVALVLIIALYPIFKKFVFKTPKPKEDVELDQLPSCPHTMKKFKLRPGYLFRELL